MFFPISHAEAIQIAKPPPTKTQPLEQRLEPGQSFTNVSQNLVSGPLVNSAACTGKVVIGQSEQRPPSNLPQPHEITNPLPDAKHLLNKPLTYNISHHLLQNPFNYDPSLLSLIRQPFETLPTLLPLAPSINSATPKTSTTLPLPPTGKTSPPAKTNSKKPCLTRPQLSTSSSSERTPSDSANRVL